MRFNFGILFLLVSFSIFAQNKITVSGKIIDKTLNQPLESATVYFQKVSDSTVVDYSISEASGNFKFSFKPIDYRVKLKISYYGYQNYEKEFQSISSDTNLGIIELEEKTTTLNELELKGEAPPIVIKTDTLEFNASSFKVRPDANVEALLKQLPGVEIDEEGKITVNGKEVNNVLVNGKPFFGKDGKIATQNLPAEMINKVQVTDTKTKQEELSGQAASSNESTINLTIDEEKNKGFFGKATAGYGTDERYESSLMLNYFKNDTKISLLGSSNNINSIGFSMNEIFDNMGGGRNNYYSSYGDGGFGMNGLRFGGSNGITKSNMLGLNYDDVFLDKKLEVNGNYTFTNSDSQNRNRTDRTNLLPDGDTQTNSQSTTNAISNNHNFSVNFEIKIDSMTSMYIEPKLRKQFTKNRSSNSSFTFDENEELLNTNESSDFSDRENSFFSNEIYIHRKFKKKGRGIGFTFENENSKNTNDTYTQNSTAFYQSGNADDERNQFIGNTDENNNYYVELEYTEPVLDSLNLSIGFNYNIDKGKDTENTFDYNAITNDFSGYNDLLSRTISSEENKFGSEIGLQLRKKKLYSSLIFGTDVLKNNHKSLYLGEEKRVRKEYIYPNARFYINWRMAKSKSLYANVNYNVNLPSASQLLPYENLSNPLNTIIGNENLKPQERYNFYTGFNNYNYSERSGYRFYAGGTLTKNNVVSTTIYDEDFKSTTSYTNVNQTSSMYGGVSFDKSYKKEKRTFKFGLGLNLNNNFNQGYTNGELYKSKGYGLTPRIRLSWDIDKLVTIRPLYNYSFNKSNFDNYVISSSENFRHNAKLEITTYYPENLVFGSDFGYTYNSNIASSFQKDFYLWNVSLGYNFFDKQLLAKVKVYDLLNQNISTRRTITPTAITDTENTVLQQYVMFSLTYKLEKFGGKKKSDNGIIFMD